MTDMKALNSLAVATLTTGITMVHGMDGVYEAAEQVMGYAVFTHELPGVQDTFTRRVVAQHPTFPIAIGPDGWEACRDAVLAEFGETIDMPRGTDERTRDPADTFLDARKAALAREPRA